MPYICTPYKISYGNIPNQTSNNRENDKNLNMYVRPSTYLIQILKLFETLSTRTRLYGINVKSNFAGWQQTIHAKIFFWKWYMMLFKFNLAHSPHMFPKNIWYLFCFAAMIFVQIMRLISHLIPPLADQIYPAMISNYKTIITFFFLLPNLGHVSLAKISFIQSFQHL